MMEFLKNINPVNLSCIFLLITLIIILIICLVKNKEEYFGEYEEDSDDESDDESGEENFGDVKNINNPNAKILIVGNKMCPFCVKATNLMDETKLNYNFIESNSPEGIKYMKQNSMNGVPLILDLKTNTVIKGFDQQKIKQLKN